MRKYITKRMVARILALREHGFTYREIDAELNLRYRSYRIMNSRMARWFVS